MRQNIREVLTAAGAARARLAEFDNTDKVAAAAVLDEILSGDLDEDKIASVKSGVEKALQGFISLLYRR